jgi:hypothetical protein
MTSIGTAGEATGVPILMGVDARARLGDAYGDAMRLAH